MLSCKEIVTIISSDNDKVWTIKVQVRLHLMMCRHCSRYAKQIEILKVSAKSLADASFTDMDEDKIKEIEDRAIEKIR